MSEHTPTTNQVRAQYADGESEGTAEDYAEFDRWLAAHDAEVRGDERERIIQDMQERSHPDDWGVSCVYVKSYAEVLRGERR